MCCGFTRIHDGLGQGSVVHYVQDKRDMTKDEENRKSQHATKECWFQCVKHLNENIHNKHIWIQ